MIPSVNIYRVAATDSSSLAGEIILAAPGVTWLIYNVLGKMTRDREKKKKVKENV